MLFFVLEEHCYVTDASITSYNLKEWVFKQSGCLGNKKYSKLLQVLLLKTSAKRGNQLWRGQKLLHCMKKGIQKSKYPKNWSSARLQSISQLSNLRRMLVFRTWAEVVGPRLPERDDHMTKKMVVCSPTTSSKKIRSSLLLTGADVSTPTVKHRFSHEFGPRTCKPTRKPRLTPSVKANRYAFAKPHLKWTV